MSEASSSESSSTPSPGGRRAFIADLSFCLLLPWLLLWRFQLSSDTSSDFWSGWMPAGVLVAFAVVAAVVGAAQGAARGFLPYALRWAGLAGVLFVAAWVVSDVASGSSASPKTAKTATQFVSAGTKAARRAAAKAKSPKEKASAERAVKASEAATLLSKAFQQAKPGDVKTPNVPEATRGAGGMGQALSLMQEHGEALGNGEMPPELAAMLEQENVPDELQELATMGGDMLQQAAVAMAVQYLAGTLGISQPWILVFRLVMELIADGEITAGDVIRLATAVGTSLDASGAFDPELLASQFQKIGDLARTVSAVVGRAEEFGISADLAPIKKILDEVGGAVPARAESTRCDAAALTNAFRIGQDASARDIADEYAQWCGNLSRSERLDKLIEGARQHRPDLLPALEAMRAGGG